MIPIFLAQAAADKPLSIYVFLIPLALVVMWPLILFQLAFIGGWRRLAKDFKTSRPPTGKRFGMESASVGWVGYNNCLTIHTNPEGIFLEPWYIFRVAHPRLFIPWAAVSVIRERSFLGIKSVKLAVRRPQVATLGLARNVVEEYLLMSQTSQTVVFN
jgi:hypothetical protein